MKYHFGIGVLLVGLIFAIAVSQAQESEDNVTRPPEDNGSGDIESAGLGEPPSGESSTTAAPTSSWDKTTTTAAPSGPWASSVPTTPTTNGGKNEVLNVQIHHVLEISKTGHYIGNLEFDQMTTVLRAAGGLGPNAVEVKRHAYDKFVAYNLHRLKLEGDLDSRIAVIDNYFYNENISDECKVFYHKQKRELTQAYTETNSLKSYKLMIYSESCPYNDQVDNTDTSDEDSDYDFWPFWGTLNKTLFH